MLKYILTHLHSFAKNVLNNASAIAISSPSEQ